MYEEIDDKPGWICWSKSKTLVLVVGTLIELNKSRELYHFNCPLLPILGI
jgi:hypothetical protein